MNNDVYILHDGLQQRAAVLGRPRPALHLHLRLQHLHTMLLLEVC